MTADAVSVTLNVLALIGAGTYVIGQMSWRETTPVNIRLASLLALLMGLIGVRALRWGLDYRWLVRLEEALAAFIPLFALILAEGMLRRHAPGRLKLIMVVGAVALAITALLRPPELQGVLAILLGAFLTGGLLAIGVLLAIRPRASLSPGENDAISAFFVGLLLAVPVASTDFLATAGLTAIRAGGLSLLIFLFFAARVTSIGGGGLSGLAEFFWTLVATALAYGALSFVAGWPEGLATIQTASILLALLLVFRIVQYVREQRRSKARQTLWRAFAEAPGESLEGFLATILTVPEFQRARLLEGKLLADYDHERLRKVFAADPVISKQDTRRKSSQEFQQLDVIFDQHEATHAVLIRARPLALLLVNMPRVGAGADVDVQLGVLTKLATQIGAPHA